MSALPAVAAAGLVAGLYLDNKHQIVADLKLARKLRGYRAAVERNFKEQRTVVDFWNETLARHPDKPSIIFIEEEGQTTRTFTFKQMDEWANRMAHFLVDKGMKRGDTVALFMENRPEFIATWLGMAKVGVKVAMINTSIKEKGLSHCVKVSSAKAIIFGSELEEPMNDVKNDIGASLIMCQGPTASTLIPESIHLDAVLPKYSPAPPPRSLRDGIGFADIFGYIYTSGTTGLPKAANIPHQKMYSFGGGIKTAFDVTEEDIVYTCLPLFHSAGGGLGAGMMVIGGSTMVLVKKFSASRFFLDCKAHNVTVVQYIGELCRYLMATKPSPADTKHKVRIAIGNGLRPEIWLPFQKRFNIPQIGEFYGATESNGALFNLCTTPQAAGAVGRMGTLLKRVTGMKLARYNVERDELVRGPDGFLIECPPGEPGELLMPIKAGDPSTKFAGYSDPAATEKKLARDAFVKGDLYFKSGDLLSCNAQGYYFFVDRIGDTFRWKGENCSTTEVTEVVSTFPGVEEANVYGVLIENNQDGRAPCAAITPKDGDIKNLDFVGFLKHCRKQLPSYAVPLFIRITEQVPVTSTLKHQKVDLRNEGINVSKVKDPIYYLHNDKFVPLTKELYAQITKPLSRL